MPSDTYEVASTEGMVTLKRRPLDFRVLHLALSMGVMAKEIRQSGKETISKETLKTLQLAGIDLLAASALPSETGGGD